MSDTFTEFVKALKRPFLAVIFQTPQTAGYPHWGHMPDSMIEFAKEQPGFLGIKTQGPTNGFSTTMTFWSNEDAMRAWEARMDSKPTGYKILISKVEDNYVKTPVA